MLRVKSFKITDDAGINELLSNFRLASGASILINEGNLCIPYEDGEEPNTAQKIIALKEERNTVAKQMDIIIHSQVVLDIQSKGIKAEIEKIESQIVTTGGKKKDYEANKSKDAEIKRLNNVLTETEKQIVMNQAEITRMQTNITVFNQRIAELG